MDVRSIECYFCFKTGFEKIHVLLMDKRYELCDRCLKEFLRENPNPELSKQLREQEKISR